MSGSGVSQSTSLDEGFRTNGRITRVFLAFLIVIASSSLVGQNPQTTDLQFHKFQPRVTPDHAVSATSNRGTSPYGISLSAAQQMQALQQEKASRTPTQQKIDSNILYTVRMLAGQPANVYITQPDTSAYADMPMGSSGGNNSSPFTVTLDSTYSCGQTIDFTLTVDYTGGPQRALHFTVPTGLLSITNTLGTTPAELPGITTATGTQVNRINRNGVISACGTDKSYPGAITGGHTFDSYTLTACRSFCMEVGLNAGASGINLFGSAYSPSFDPNSIGTNYAGDAGLSTNTQSFGISTTDGSSYRIVVNDVAGNPLPPPAPPNTYTIQIPSCAINCTVNQLPVAAAHDVTVTPAHGGSTASANIDDGSNDPEGGAITLTQTPAGPYSVGITSVMLTVVDDKGATAQTTANATVNSPPNQPPVVLAHDVTVIADDVGGTAAASIDNGSYDPDDDAITVTQTPAGPYPVGVTSVTLTVEDAFNATSQTTANVTVANPAFTLAPTLPSVTVNGWALSHGTHHVHPQSRDYVLNDPGLLEPAGEVELFVCARHRSRRQH